MVHVGYTGRLKIPSDYLENDLDIAQVAAILFYER